jgi:hypothetical protein
MTAFFNWIKNNSWLGWLLSGILICILLWLLFRPAPTTDNTAALKTIDSLTTENVRLRKIMEGTVDREKPQIDSVLKLNDSLLDYQASLQNRIDISDEQNISLSHVIQDLRKQIPVDINSTAYDSACDLLAKNAENDSLLHKLHEQNLQRVIIGYTKAVDDQDSIIVGQHNLIINDSLLISHQAPLIITQQSQIKKLQKQNKVAKIAGGILIVIAFIGGVLIAK